MNFRDIIEAAFRHPAATGVQDGARSLFAGYMAALGELATDAIGWATFATNGTTCGLRVIRPAQPPGPCGEAAIGRCEVCGSALCFGHAFVAPRRLLCMGCVEAARQQFAGATGPGGARWRPAPYAEPVPPPPRRPFGFVDPDDLDGASYAALRRKHLRRLKLDDSASAGDIDKAYKRVAREQHPDRAPVAERERATERLKKINDAYTWLKKHDRAAA